MHGEKLDLCSPFLSAPSRLAVATFDGLCAADRFGGTSFGKFDSWYFRESFALRSNEERVRGNPIV